MNAFAYSAPLSDNASYQERQDEEFQVLESIYGGDLEDLRKKVAWKVARPLELKLTLKPQHSMGGGGQAYVQLDLVIKCSPRYPDVPPEISFINSKGLSFQLIGELKAKLEKSASQHAGEVMIWQLATEVESFLDNHNNPPPKSFYDQMISNKKQQQEKIKEMERLKEEMKRQEMEQGVLKCQEYLKSEETRRRKGDYKSIETSISPSVTFHHANSFTPSLSPIPVHQHNVTQTISPDRSKNISTSPNGSTPSLSQRQRRTSTPKRNEDDESGKNLMCRTHNESVSLLTFTLNGTEQKIQRGKCLGHSNSGSTMYVGMDMVSGELVAIAEWVLKWRHISKKVTVTDKDNDPEGETHFSQVLSIEQEFRTLLKLNHPNLIHYKGWKYDRHPGKITLHVLMEYSGGTNLSVYAHLGHSLPLELLRLYTSELLQAIQYLHQNYVVHKNLRASSIFIDRNGKVRLGDYSIDKRLGDLYEAVDKTRSGVRFSDTRPLVLGRGGQKGDIYQLGLMLLTLILGQPLLKSLPDIPSSLPSVVQDFLNKCLLRDERLRWTAVQLLEHGFIKEQLPLFPIVKTGQSTHNRLSAAKDMDEASEDNSDTKEEEEFEYLNSLVASGQSRLASEFELLRVLGKGGFGDVIKVKNKLDGRFYAIKRIPLNPRSKMFNKKMKREVKLLSRLNHENVVRYYCSWIEISDNLALSESSSSYTPSSHTQEAVIATKKAPHIVKVIPLTKTPILTAGVRSANSSFDPISDLENLVPRATDETNEWTTSLDACAINTLDSSSSSSSEDEADVFGTSFMPKMDRSEDSIIFDDENLDSKNKVNSVTEVSVELSMPRRERNENMMLKILYIQMEYCEKSTLRNCIDAGLCNDMNRVWRLFREIIEGLVHIHSKGMIHRDLKPVNIFLDSHDHVKIGDFGLATTDIIAKQGAVVDPTLPSQEMGLNLSRSGCSSGDGNLTGRVGTALYVSPEIMKGMGKVHYDQKVDIYSLGIIFFEMCYKSLSTGMERVRIINSLRQPEVTLPEDFNRDELNSQAKIIRWLLNHEPSMRPTSKELLSSDFLPPPLMQETELSEILRSTIGNPQSTSYRYMLNAIFKQKGSPLHDVTYDQTNFDNIISWKTALVYQQLETVLLQVFTTHGAIHIPLPLMMPKCSVYEDNEQIVMVMDHRGGIVTLPFDHRVPLARYVMRNNVQSLKRYALGRVFREKKFYNVLFNVHPKELTECSFDIITPSNSASLIPDAEVLTVVQEIINKYPSLQARNYYVRINHMSLLKAVLLHCGIPENLHNSALLLLTEKTPTKTKSRISDLESELKIKLSDQATTQLNVLLNLEGPVDKISRDQLIRSITKGTAMASSWAKSGLHDIENIISHAVSLGLKLKIIVTVGLIYNPNQYSGVIFEVMCDSQKKKKLLPEVLAAGGRYDKLIEKFKIYQSTCEFPHGVGISLSFDRLAAVVADEEKNKNLSPCDVIVCSLGRHMMVKERLAVARELRSAGFRTDVLFDKPEDFDALQENCRNMGISFIVILKESETLSSSTVKVQCLDKMTEKNLDSKLLIEYLNKLKYSKESEKSSSLEFGSNLKVFVKDNQCFGDGSHSSLGSCVSLSNSNGPTFNYNIVFVSQDSKKNQITRRKQEAIIANKIASQFPWLPEKNLDVLALDLTVSSIKIIQAYLELNSEESFEASMRIIMEKLVKFRKYLTEVFDAIYDLKFKKECRFILLYSIKEESLRLIMAVEDASSS